MKFPEFIKNMASTEAEQEELKVALIKLFSHAPFSALCDSIYLSIAMYTGQPTLTFIQRLSTDKSKGEVHYTVVIHTLTANDVTAKIKYQLTLSSVKVFGGLNVIDVAYQADPEYVTLTASPDAIRQAKEESAETIVPICSSFNFSGIEKELTNIANISLFDHLDGNRTQMFADFQKQQESTLQMEKSTAPVTTPLFNPNAHNERTARCRVVTGLEKSLAEDPVTKSIVDTISYIEEGVGESEEVIIPTVFANLNKLFQDGFHRGEFGVVGALNSGTTLPKYFTGVKS